jgi:hypothetical protein
MGGEDGRCVIQEVAIAIVERQHHSGPLGVHECEISKCDDIEVPLQKPDEFIEEFWPEWRPIG